MTATISDVWRVSNTGLFLNDFLTNSYYMLIAKELPWTNDASPDLAQTYIKEVYDLWNNAYAAKLITPNNVSYCIPYRLWTTGTAYDQYDAYDIQMSERSFYVITSGFNVYKCLSNFGGALSTVEPVGTGAAVITTGDGYRWKYMYSLSAVLVNTFLTAQFMPVIDIPSNAIPAGSIESFRVTNPGSLYTPNSVIPVTVTGNGFGATANAYVDATGVISHVEAITGGSGYTYATVTIPPPAVGGLQAVALPNLAPIGGHGASNIQELFAHFAMINMQLQYNEGGAFPIDNDFRQVFVVRNPTLFGSGTVASGLSYNQTTKLVFPSSTGTFVIDEVVTTPGGARGTVVDVIVAPLQTTVSVNQIQGTFNPGDVITGGTSGATTTVTSITNPGLNLFSGRMLYFENRTPIPRAINQIENVIVVFEF